MKKILDPAVLRNITKLMLALLAALLMLLFVLSSDSLLLERPRQAAVCAALLCAAAMLPLITDRQLDAVSLTVAALGAAALIFVRICLFHYASADYTEFLEQWVEDMRPLCFSQAVQSDIGNYNVPYEYLLFAISRTDWNSLYAIKTVSCLFDVLGACYMMKLCAHYTDSIPARVVAYLAVLALPTVWLNSAYWAQCDMLYAALCLGMLYHMLKKQSIPAVLLWALALCIKLQAIFALPVLLLGLFTRRIRLRSLVWAPVVFAVCLLPALLGGQTLESCLQIYADQSELYPQMHLNAPSLWVLLGHVEVEPFGKAALFLAGCAALVFLYLCWQWRDGLSDELLPMVFFTAVLLLPFTLPHMHDRYFFLADLASLLVFLQNRRRWPLPLIMVLASYSCYRAFLMYQNPVLDMKWHAIMLLAMLGWLLHTVFTKMHTTAAAVPKAEAGHTEPLHESNPEPLLQDAASSADNCTAAVSNTAVSEHSV